MLWLAHSLILVCSQKCTRTGGRLDVKNIILEEHMKSRLQQRIAVGVASGFSRRSASLFLTALSIGVAAFGFAFAAIVSAAVLDIRTLSTRPDRVSGGDVLVQITQDNNTAMPVLLNGTDVTTAFRAGSAPNTRVGLVSGLIVGTNNLSSGGVNLQINNYQTTGPITSWPVHVPFFCETQDFTPPYGTKPGFP